MSLLPLQYMKPIITSILLVFCILFAQSATLTTLSNSKKSADTQRDQKELKEYLQRLSKLTTAYHRNNTTDMKTFYEAVKADVRREVAQIKARTIQARQGISEEIDPSLSPENLKELGNRADRMVAIKDFLGRHSFSQKKDKSNQMNELLMLLKEFGELMKEDLTSMKRAK